MSAFGRKTCDLVLHWEPPSLNPLDRCHDDQWLVAERGEGGSLFERHWQLGKLVALNAVEVRGRCDGAFFVTSWFR